MKTLSFAAATAKPAANSEKGVSSYSRRYYSSRHYHSPTKSAAIEHRPWKIYLNTMGHCVSPLPHISLPQPKKAKHCLEDARSTTSIWSNYTCALASSTQPFHLPRTLPQQRRQQLCYWQLHQARKPTHTIYLHSSINIERRTFSLPALPRRYAVR